MIQLGQIQIDIATGIIITAIIGIFTYISNSWHNRRKEIKREKILNNRYKEALITLAESFDDEVKRLHPDQNIPLVKPKIKRLVEDGDEDF